MTTTIILATAGDQVMAHVVGAEFVAVPLDGDRPDWHIGVEPAVIPADVVDVLPGYVANGKTIELEDLREPATPS